MQPTLRGDGNTVKRQLEGEKFLVLDLRYGRSDEESQCDIFDRVIV